MQNWKPSPRGRCNGLTALLCITCLVLGLAFPGALKADDANDNKNLPAKTEPNRIDPEVVNDLLTAGMDKRLPVRDRVEALRYAAKFPYQEVVDTLLAILAVEIDSNGQGSKNQGPDFYFIKHLFEALGESATSHSLDDFHEVASLLIGKDFSDEETEELVNIVAAARVKISSRQHQLNALPKISNRFSESGQSLATASSRFEQKLNELIVGQPHVVEKLARLRSRDNFYDYRDDPAFMWFMGPPGTGKDTAVRAYVAAIHGDEQAHKHHIYRVDPLREQSDLWSFLGSSTGYVGSENFPPVLKFLVDHSGGRYRLVEMETARGGSSYKIEENPLWRPGDILPGYSSPDRGVIYFDEFHDWAMSLKNAVVKKAVEYEGYWKINNPNGGLSEIYVPITIVASSNDGIELVTSREKNGQRFGRPLSYEEMMQKSNAVRNDPMALRNSILKGNGAVNSPKGPVGKGTSEELLNRIPEDHLILFDPLSPEHLRQIAEMKLQKLRENIRRSRSGFGNVNLTWTPEVIQFLQEYHYVAEDQARPVDNRVRSLIEATIIQAAKKDLIPQSKSIDLKIDVEKQPDNTWKMKFQLRDLTNSTELPEIFDLDIEETISDRARQPISDERLDELSRLPQVLKSAVVGQTHVLDKVARAIMLSEEGRQGIRSAADAKEAARVFMFLGPTSTGKTETSKVISEILFKTRLAAVTIDCTSLQTIEAMLRKFLGHKDAEGNPIESDFMKHYDRNSGHLVVVLDELANVRDKEVLNALFDLFREPVLGTFSDNQERIMSNVVFVITGNASQEILAQLPQDIPEEILREAWADIYDLLESDPHLRRSVLEDYFTPPFIARVGDNRIFFYKPLGYTEVRELTQMKFESLIDEIESAEGRRGWSVRVPNQNEYIRLMEALETHGFILKEQGASIDHYVRRVFGEELRSALLLNKVPNGEAVNLTFDKVSETQSAEGQKRHNLQFTLKTSSGRVIQFTIDGKPLQHKAEKLKRDQIITSAHEAGHAVVGLSLLSDFHVPTRVRILPGITRLGSEWIYYAGVASRQAHVLPETTREYLVREIAVLMGGTMAENLVIIGGFESAGRHNDIQRATEMAKKAILELGMSDIFGKVVSKESDLSESERTLLREEIRSLLKEGEDMAKAAILANKDLFVALTNELARKGELSGEQIRDIVQENGLMRDYDGDFSRLAHKNAESFNSSKMKDRPGLKYEFVKSIPLLDESEVADIHEILTKRKQKILSQVAIPKDAALAGRAPRKKKNCAQLLSQK